MPKMITFGSEMIRINPAKNCIEYSTNAGRSWISRYTARRVERSLTYCRMVVKS